MNFKTILCMFSHQDCYHKLLSLWIEENVDKNKN